jgi:hypothetical protein
VKSSIIGAALALGVASCDQLSNSSSADNSPIVSYARTDPGSKARPSNRHSRQLFEMADQVRLATFRNYMAQSGEQCALVTSAVLRGGSHHTDMWRVACSDTGEWMVSIDPDSSTKILSCATVKQLGDDCHAVWKK